ncbi:co-chaperone GroES, partial [Staphylococcus aureus]
KPSRFSVNIERTDHETTSSSGIVLKESAKEKSKEGVTVAVGTGGELNDRTKETPEENEGESSMLQKYASTE